MTLRNSRQTGRLRLRHLMEHTEAVAEEMADERSRFNALAEPGASPRIVSSFSLFQTPTQLADTLASMFNRFGRTLEPSAGLGRLYKAIRRTETACEIVMVEQSADCCRELYSTTEGDQNAKLIQGDFLTQTAERLGLFDSIMMNPPFKNGLDIKHIEHAAALLAEGGRLVSVCYNGPRQQRKFRDQEGYEYHILPTGSFRSEGTNAETAIVVIDR